MYLIVATIKYLVSASASASKFNSFLTFKRGNRAQCVRTNEQNRVSRHILTNIKSISMCVVISCMGFAASQVQSQGTTAGTAIVTLNRFEAANAAEGVDVSFCCGPDGKTDIGNPIKGLNVDLVKKELVITTKNPDQIKVGVTITIAGSISKTVVKTLTVDNKTWTLPQKVDFDIPGRPGPGFSPPFELGPIPLEITEINPITGFTTSGILASNFELEYTNPIGVVFDVTIFGFESYIRLQDGTYIGFPNMSDFGTIEIPANIDAGRFDFFGIGVSGDWSFDPTSGQTTYSARNVAPFTALSITAVDEPATLILLLIALVILGGTKRKSENSKKYCPN